MSALIELTVGIVLMVVAYVSAEVRARVATRRADRLQGMVNAMGDLQDGTWYRLTNGQFTPGRITCPECGTRTISCAPEGDCRCENGHLFWDTNAPEWVALRGRRVPNA